ncbi:MAG TPA: NADH-quinone oxidoreductase subunit M [Dehalococcoidia bacterium]|nr:NADH-quinone oxidoreductase subunit M [Dehalococcoidia bacterium]
MILTWLIVEVFVGGLLAWISGRWSRLWPRVISLVILSVHMAVLIVLWVRYFGPFDYVAKGPWVIEVSHSWIPQLGISFQLSMDGLSMLLIVLTNFLGIIAVACSWNAIQERVGFFHFNLLWIVASIMGVFLATDLFLFYFFWEMMLVPLYFLIGFWGYENRTYASIKFFIFTQAGGLLMLLAILGLYFVHGRATGVYTFDYNQLLGTPMSDWTARWLMLGFFVAFAVKLPVVPLHTWLPDAHTQAPTAGSVNLAGLVLKVGAYGMIRFLVPLFPKAALDFSDVAMGLAVAGIIYGAVLAFAQTDIKRLVAYTSISHMGFVLLGIFAWNELALEGAVMIMLAHAVTTGALFILVGDLNDRIHTRDMGRMGGLWQTVPRMGGVALFFAVASLGLPGLGNFVGEFLVVLGTYQSNTTMAVLATLGLIVSVVYSLWMIQVAFLGPNHFGWKLPDMNLREGAIMATMIAAITWFGLYPQSILATAKQSIANLQQTVTTTRPAETTQPPGDSVSLVLPDEEKMP